MNKLRKLFEIVKKEVVSIKEFQYIANHDFVVAVTYIGKNQRHKDCVQYVVQYENSDSNIIYVKRA